MTARPVFIISVPEYHEFLKQNNIDNTPKVYQVYSLLKLEAAKDYWVIEQELSQARKLIAELVKMGEFYSRGFATRVSEADYSNVMVDDMGPFNITGKFAREVLSNNKDLIEKLTKE